MDKFYGKFIFETAVPVENSDNLMLFLNSIEFQKPELLRLDFATIRTSVSKNPDGTCILTANCFDFDYNTYKADYEKLGLEADGFTYDYFKSISNDSLKLTEILAECEVSCGLECSYMKILSCGAGMQSTALALMSCENKMKGIIYSKKILK